MNRFTQRALLLTIALLLPSTINAKPETSLQAVRSQLANIIETRQNATDYSNIPELEPAAITAAKGHAERTGNKLTLHFSNGQAKNYINKTKCDDDEHDCQTFILIAYVDSINLFILQHSSYEYYGVMIVDARTGRETDLSNIPSFSPDGSRFLILAGSGGGGDFWPTQIWRRDGDSVTVEWEHKYHYPYKSDAITAAKWKSNDLVEITMASGLYGPYIDPDANLTYYTGTLTRSDRGWALQNLVKKK